MKREKKLRAWSRTYLTKLKKKTIGVVWEHKEDGQENT